MVKKKSLKKTPPKKSPRKQRGSYTKKSPPKKTPKKSPKKRSYVKKSPPRSGRTKYQVSGSGRRLTKDEMVCNRPYKSWAKHKKRSVKVCSGGREKIIHYGDSRYGHNISPERRRNFRSRHRCNEPKSKFSAGYWACKDLWP